MKNYFKDNEATLEYFTKKWPKLIKPFLNKNSKVECDYEIVYGSNGTLFVDYNLHTPTSSDTIAVFFIFSRTRHETSNGPGFHVELSSIDIKFSALGWPINETLYTFSDTDLEQFTTVTLVQKIKELLSNETLSPAIKVAHGIAHMHSKTANPTMALQHIDNLSADLNDVKQLRSIFI